MKNILRIFARHSEVKGGNMENGKCCICKSEVDKESAPILTMGGFGNPRYLCDKCAGALDCASTARNVPDIEAAMAYLSKKLTDTGVEDKTVLDTVSDMFSEAGERAKQIKNGTYDFSNDETENEADTDVPEELLESEEDKALDLAEAETNKKLDKVFNIITAVLIALAIGFFVYYFISRFN